MGFDSAPELALVLLGPESTRLEHVAGVAQAAARAQAAVPTDDVALLLAAAWLHDIGYSAAVTDTGFHPLDGARFLRRIGAPERLCRLVAHHTASPIEATARGLREDLMREFPPEESPTADALTYADMTTGPDGLPVSALERVLEILTRYPSEHVVHASISQARPDLLATVERVDARLAEVQLRWLTEGDPLSMRLDLEAPPADDVDPLSIDPPGHESRDATAASGQRGGSTHRTP